jgi:hypothetical protein
MHDVAERIEVGVLSFSDVLMPDDNEVFIDTPAFLDRIEPSKLTIKESGFSAESGIVLRASNGEAIVLLAAAYPYGLAVQGLLREPYLFRPEYSLEHYISTPMR